MSENYGVKPFDRSVEDADAAPMRFWWLVLLASSLLGWGLLIWGIGRLLGLLP